MNHPQILLLGNGLNLAYDGLRWAKLIEKISTNPKVHSDCLSQLPFPMQAVIATQDHVDTCLKDKCRLLYGLESIEKLRPLMERLLEIPFDHILTTNYSYEIERVANSMVNADGSFCVKFQRKTNAVNRAESKYMLHTYNTIDFHGYNHKVWHIHGEARKPGSVILGHYYYGSLLGKYQEELKKRGNKQFLRQKNKEDPLLESWLDAFIMGDVYVLGFSFDYSEMDLWWLLNRKKREQAEHGILHYYSPLEEAGVKYSLMEAYEAEVHHLGYYQKPSDYKEFYKKAIADIRSRVQKRAVAEIN